MAFPTIVDKVISGQVTSESNTILTLPTYTVGDMLVVSVYSTYYGVIEILNGSGWTTEPNYPYFTKSLRFFYKISDGNDAIQLNNTYVSGGSLLAYQVYSINGASNITFSEPYYQDSGVSTIYQTPGLDMVSTKEYLWFTMCNMQTGYWSDTPSPPWDGPFQSGGGTIKQSTSSKGIKSSYQDPDNYEVPSFYMQQAILMTWAITPKLPKLIIGIQNSKKISLTGNIIKDNLIIKD